MSKEKIELGNRPSKESPQRDAVHVAIIKAVAGETLARGEWVSLQEGKAFQCAAGPHAIGLVDPFTHRFIKEGDAVWIMLKPGTITGLRHTWDHPMIPTETPQVTAPADAQPQNEDDYDPCSDMGCE